MGSPLQNLSQTVYVVVDLEDSPFRSQYSTSARMLEHYKLVNEREESCYREL